MFLNGTCLDMLNVHVYYKHGNRLSEQATKILTNKLTNNLQKTNFKDETEERLAAIRRFNVYKELADAQIRHVLSTMLTLKVVDEAALDSSASENL